MPSKPDASLQPRYNYNFSRPSQRKRRLADTPHSAVLRPPALSSPELSCVPGPDVLVI